MRRSVVVASVLSFLLVSVCPGRVGRHAFPGTLSAEAGEIGFVEDFALADNRAEALGKLIPGTRDYYYYRCLHLENTGRLDEVERVLKTWIDRHGRTARAREIENRLCLFRYETDPAKSLDFLRRRLGLRFDHQRQAPGQKTRHPTRLDPTLISRDTLKKRALGRHKNLHGFNDSGLALLTQDDLRDLTRLRDLLRRLRRPDYPNLPELVARELTDRRSSGFGSFGIHKAMLLDQLEECARLKGDLINNTNFVGAYITKLQPNPDVDWQHDDDEKAAYLGRLLAFARKLSPAHNSLKAHVIYHRLVYDRSKGTYDKGLFMEYVKLPRNVPYISPTYARRSENRRASADLRRDYRKVTLFPPVRNDEPLVRGYLAHFFLEGEPYSSYTRYMRESYLKEVYAETMILEGRGDMERWYSLLDSPRKYQALKERIDIDFAPTNRTYFLPDEPVSLDVYVKNVKTLIVKVFEINTINYYRDKKKDVDSQLDLDGLVASEEKVHTLKETPFKRMLRRFELPSLSARGVYVVEFIGGGKSSRALVRKGRLRFIERSSVAGHIFTVMDESNSKLGGATLWMAGHEYKADKDGTITVPFTNKPTLQYVVLTHRGFSTLEQFSHKSEGYSLRAGFYVERESLLKGGEAKVIVRPVLRVSGRPCTLSVLEDVVLVIRSRDHEGVNTTKEVRDFKLSEDRECAYEFRVPENLSGIYFTLKAKVQCMSQNKKVDLSTSEWFGLNDINRTEKTGILHLARTARGYTLHLLGKTGEVRPGRPVKLQLQHRDFREPVHVVLQADDEGRIVLGALADITSFRAIGPEATTCVWYPARDNHSFPVSIHGRAGETVRIPYMGKLEAPDRGEFSLLEKRGETFFKNRFEALAIADGFVEVRGLPAGDYGLLLKESNSRIDLRLTEGEAREGYVLSDKRLLEVKNAKPLQITSVEPGAAEVRISLANASEFARVHVFGTRFMPAYELFTKLGKPGFSGPKMVELTKHESHYVSGRDIGDEYSYILARKYAKKYPGNMLKRPGLLLNPWALEEAETGLGVGGGVGDSYGFRTGGGRRRAALRGGGSARSVAGTGHLPDLDFLAGPAAVMVNLRPDKNGVVTVARKDLGGSQLLRVVAVDPENTAYREVPLAETETKYKDLRLVKGLDPDGHQTEKKQISILRAGDELVIEDITTSDVEIYDTLAKVYSLYATLARDKADKKKIAEFGFIQDWPKLKPDQKREEYSKYACHELSFFVYKRDPAFFMEVVLPYLKNKKDKTFVDHMLLGRDLTAYVKPWAHAQLNIPERILLAQFVRGEAAPTARHVRELYELVPPDVERANFLFDTASKRGALETKDGLGLRAARKLAEEREDLAEAVVRAPAAKSPARPRAPKPAESRSRGARRKLAAAAEAEEPPPGKDAPDDGALAKKGKSYFARGDKEKREQVRQLFRKLEKTKELVENNYYHLPIEQQKAGLVTVNALWRDYAAAAGGDGFLSREIARASRNFTEMMLAMALLDLPFEAGKHETKYDGKKLTVRMKSGGVAFHKEIKEAEVARDAQILIRQNFFRLGDRYRHVGNERLDKYVTDEFVVNTVYGCQVVITNPTSSPQKLDLLLEIPRGAMPVKKGFYTRGRHVRLGAYSTTTFEYHFYFPEPGSFAHYPVHVAKNERVIAFVEPVSLGVVARPTIVDTTSWDYVSQNGTEDEVLRFLDDNNPHRADLSRIAWRCAEREFFNRVRRELAAKHVYDHTLWSYGIRHDAPEAVREYLQHAEAFLNQCGPYIDTPLVTIDPVIRKSYQHMEYEPLVNARAHRFGKRRKIMNERFLAQYNRLMRVLCYRPALDDDDLMSAAYYMLLQDRVEEALRFFSRVDPAKIATRIQHDYMKAYLGFYTEDTGASRAIASRYKAYPVVRWRNVFLDVLGQLDEIEGKAPAVVDDEDRAQRQTALASTEPGFEFKVEAKRVTLDYRNIRTCRVNYYLMDVELLFSRNPFVQEYGGRFSYIRPNETDLLPLPPRKTVHAFEIPRRFHNANVLVEIEAGGAKKSRACFSNSLALQVVENYGQLSVAHEGTGRPLPRVYVKVYGRLKGGKVAFYKDGYTDLRGRFDYASLSTNEIDTVERFSILILSEEFGGVVREADPPKR